MQTIFQGETGGTLAFPYSASILATSGYLVLTGPTHYLFTLDGFIASGQLFIHNSALSSLPPAKYIAYPQIVDIHDDVWYLTELDIEIESVPNYPQAYVTTAPSILQRLDALEADVSTITGYAQLNAENVFTQTNIVTQLGVGIAPDALPPYAVSGNFFQGVSVKHTLTELPTVDYGAYTAKFGYSVHADIVTLLPSGYDTSDANVHSGSFNAYSDPSAITAAPYLIGIEGFGYHRTPAHIQLVNGGSFYAYSDSELGISQIVGAYVEADNYSTTGLASEVIGLEVGQNYSTGPVTSRYGIKIRNQTTGPGDNVYAIYSDGGTVHYKVGAAALKGLVVQGAVSQVESLQEWQNSTGTILALVDSLGQITATRAAIGNNAQFSVDYDDGTGTENIFASSQIITNLKGRYTDEAYWSLHAVELSINDTINSGVVGFSNALGGYFSSYVADTSTGLPQDLTGLVGTARNGNALPVGEMTGISARAFSYATSNGENITGITSHIENISSGKAATARVFYAYPLFYPAHTFGTFIGIDVADYSNVAADTLYALRTQGGAVLHKAGAVGVVPLALQRATSQSTDIFRLLDSDGSSILHRYNKDGYWITNRNSAPADSDLSANDCALWFDSQNTTPSLKIKAKKANGAVVTGTVLLT